MTGQDPYDLDQIQVDDDLRRSAENLSAEVEDKIFAWVMDGPKGRRFVRQLLGRTGVFRSAFSANAMQMAAAEGNKQIGYWLLEQIERLCPADYHTMIEEAKKYE